jgi:hypothetical protein
VGVELVDLVLGDGEAHFAFCFRQDDPKASPEAEAALVAEEFGHFARGIAGDERVLVVFVGHGGRPGLGGLEKLVKAGRTFARWKRGFILSCEPISCDW